MVDLSQYLPILIYLFVAFGLSSLFVFLPMAVSRLTGTHNPDAEKNSEYECGFPAFEDSREPFDVRFYLVAILFVVFDIEAAFLFPWAVSLKETGWTGWLTMVGFIFELLIDLAKLRCALDDTLLKPLVRLIERVIGKSQRLAGALALDLHIDAR